MWEEIKKVLRDRIREVIPFSHLNTQNHDRILQIGDKICSQEYVNGNWETKNCIDIDKNKL